jgi:hypothetical protein
MTGTLAPFSYIVFLESSIMLLDIISSIGFAYNRQLRSSITIVKHF